MALLTGSLSTSQAPASGLTTGSAPALVVALPQCVRIIGTKAAQSFPDHSSHRDNTVCPVLTGLTPHTPGPCPFAPGMRLDEPGHSIILGCTAEK